MATPITKEQFQLAKEMEQEIDALQALIPQLQQGRVKHIVLSQAFPDVVESIRDLANQIVANANDNYLTGLSARLLQVQTDFDSLFADGQQQG